MKDYRSALADYTRAIELDPSEPGSDDRGAAHTFANRAYVRLELGDGKGALEDYRQALLIRPCLYCNSGSGSVSQANKADAFFQKGLALLRRGDKSASRQNLEEAARLFYAQGDMPKYQSVKYHLSRF
jgi:tetratricopeptide (TPR) repeat protein